MSATVPAKSRLSYIDWMRGLACVLMFQTHCYDSWLSPQARQSKFFMYSQLGGTFPAPLFLFLAGFSFALITEKLWQKNLSASTIARTTIVRGAQILGFGLLFRVQEYVIAWGWAPVSDLLRVDVLNTIGVSMMLMGVMCWIVLSVNRRATGYGRSTRAALIASAMGTAVVLALMAPMIWTTWRIPGLPWPIESYINGVNQSGVPQPWLFPIFPWTGFSFAGLALGFVLQSTWARERETSVLLSVGAAGVVLVEFARWLEARPQIYAAYDYWHTSPNFFLIRIGMLLMILSVCYAWCRWGLGQWGLSPLIRLGQASLLVYWVHLEFVYGRFSILPKRSVSIATASWGLLVIFLSMLLLALVRTRARGRILPSLFGSTRLMPGNAQHPS